MCLESVVWLLPVRLASSCLLIGGVTQPSQARARNWIQVISTVGGNLRLKMRCEGMKIPRGGNLGWVIVTLEGRQVDLWVTTQL